MGSSGEAPRCGMGRDLRRVGTFITVVVIITIVFVFCGCCCSLLLPFWLLSFFFVFVLVGVLVLVEMTVVALVDCYGGDEQLKDVEAETCWMIT